LDVGALARLGLIALAILACRDSRAPTPAPVSQQAGEDAGARSVANRSRDDWYGLYLGDKKVGFAHFTVGRDGAVIRTRVDAVIRTKGVAADQLRIVETKVFDGKPPFGLREVVIEEHSDDGKSVGKAVRDGGELVSGDRRVRSGETLESELIESVAAIEGWQKGREARAPQFDLEVFRDRIARVQVVEARTGRAMGVQTEQVVVDFWAEGESSALRSVYDRSGRLLRGANGDFRFRLEDSRTAQSEIEGFDIIDDAIAVKRKLGDPSRRAELKLVVAVRDGFRIPRSDNQQVEARPDGRFLVTRKRSPGSALPKDLEPWLQPTERFDFRHPKVAQLATELGASRLDPRAYATTVVTWVYGNLDKDLSTNLARASDVVAKRVGDCTEHSQLTIALMRAGGLPAREVSGLIYMGDDVQRFGFHSWVEVGLAGRWVPVDPSWNQMLADPSHLKLGVGESAEWLGTMASLRIEVPAPD
jgi:transglutaminase-like putative cysteine protease